MTYRIRAARQHHHMIRYRALKCVHPESVISADFDKRFIGCCSHARCQENPGLRLAAQRTANLELLGRSLDELAELCAGERRAGVMRLLHHLVPEYQHEPTKIRAAR